MPMKETGTVFQSADDLPREEVVEVLLLLPVWEAAELERTAHQDGQTVGQLLRRLIRSALPCAPQASAGGERGV
jgi:hypothetical protein